MNPVILLVVGMLLIYSGATGRAEAVWTALTTGASGGSSGKQTTATKVETGGGGTANEATK